MSEESGRTVTEDRIREEGQKNKRGSGRRIVRRKRRIGGGTVGKECRVITEGGGVEEGGRGEEPPWVALARNDSDVGCDRSSGM